jgi:hypothetical protein
VRRSYEQPRAAVSFGSASFGFTIRHSIGHCVPVRVLATLVLTNCVVWTACAQDQERSLVDRLLKPNTALQNPAQNKNFRTAGGSIDKRATVVAFNFENKTKPTKYSDTRNFRSRDFNARDFADGKHRNNAADTRSNTVGAYSGASSTHPVREVYDHDRSANSREFAGQRPFLDRGKSEKSLNRQNPPMTIEQVRELLNKNK